MLWRVVLCLLPLHFYGVASQGECTDLRGRLISHGLHYVPGPDTCTLCVCDNGLPKVCKAVLCSPPQDCRSFRVGNTCCEFICLDDVVKPAEGAEANVRVAAGGAAVVVLLTVALVVYRVRKQKRRRPPHADDQRSLTSIGYISGSMGYMGGTCETAMAGWKPPGNYLPRGEAPPPYDEVVAQCRNENMRLQTEQSFHRTYPATVETLSRPEDPMQCSGHGYANITRPMAQMPNPQNCYNAPLLQPVHPPEPREPNSMLHHPLAPNMVGFPHAVRLTGSLGAISNRGLLSLLQREPAPERPHNVPGFYANAAVMHASHRTIPRISTTVDTTMLDSGLGGFNRCGERGLGEIRRSFHRPGEPRAPPADTGRSMPRNLNLASAVPDLPDLPHLRSRDPPSIDSTNMRLPNSGVGSGGGCAGAERREETGAEKGAKPLPPPKPAPPPPDAAHQTLPLTVDKPSCVCSYSSATGSETGGEHSEETDDYRSECENCKAASSSRWVVEEGWDGEEEDGTQTLQRRAPAAPAPHQPATSTLPQPVTKQPRTIMGPPSNWENWFNTIHDSDTESEEE